MLLSGLLFPDSERINARTSNVISTAAPVDSPDISLFIRDAKSGQPIPVTGIKGADGEYIQTVSLQLRPARFVPLFEGVLTSSSTTTAKLWTRRSQYILVQLSQNSATDQISMQPIYFDVWGYPYIGETQTSVTASVTDVDGVFYPQVLAFDSLGADLVMFVVNALSGTLYSVYATAL